jgi:hypothetical protein
MRYFVAPVLLLVVCAALLKSQEKDEPRTDDVSQLRKEIAALKLSIDSLRTAQNQAGLAVEDEIDNEADHLEQRLQKLENNLDALGRSVSPVVFNPSTTAFINFAARADNKQVLDATGQHVISDRPFLRTVEMDMRAAVDPYADAVAIISLENEAGKDYGVDAEEAYGLIKRLPILESAPLGLKVKIGKFRAPLGTDNMLHMHDLPWTTRPLVVTRYLGTEHGDFFESGYSPVGMDLNFFLPNPIPSSTLEMNADIVRGGELALSQGHPGDATAVIGHLNLSSDYDNQNIIVLGASGYHENASTETNLGGVDFTYKWSPVIQRESKSFVLGGEAFVGQHSFHDSLGAKTTSNPVGGFAYAQYQMSFWVYTGIRYDQIEEPSNDHLTTKSVSLYISYYTTEFLRLRIGFEHRMSDIPAQNNINTVNFELNLVYGSHPTEPYWVNR